MVVGEGNGNPLQYSCLENPMDQEPGRLQSMGWQIDGETMETVTDFILGAPKSLQMVTAARKLKDTCSLEEKI